MWRRAHQKLSPLPPVSAFGPIKFSSAPPITSSYFLSGTALRKQSELRVRGGPDSQQLTRQERAHAGTRTQTRTKKNQKKKKKLGRRWCKRTPHALLAKANICSLIPAVQDQHQWPTPLLDTEIIIYFFFLLLHTSRQKRCVSHMNLGCCCLVNK